MEKRTGLLIRSIVGSALIGFLLFVVLAATAPDSVAFSPNNYGWNGIHQVATNFPIQFVNKVPSTSNRTTLLIIQPVTPFSQMSASELEQFVRSGGTLVIADSRGVSNTLLSYMNLDISIQGGTMINDPIYNWKSSTLPTILVSQSIVPSYPAIFSGVRGIALDEPSPLQVSSGSQVIVVATSSASSFEANRTSGLRITLQNNPAHIATGPFPVAAAVSVGNGTVIVIGDSLFFTNPVWNIADNRVLITNLLNDSSDYLLTSNWPQNTIASFKAEILSVYSVISEVPIRYLFTAGIVGLGLVLLPVFSGIDKTETAKFEEAKYDQRILEKIRRDRNKWGKI